MISISEESWHYRINSNVRDELIPTNLCPYVRFTVVTLAVLSAIGLVVSSVTYMTLVTWLAMFAGSFTGPQPVYAVGLICTLVLIIVGITYSCLAIDKRHPHMAKQLRGLIPERPERPEREPNIFIEWIKAKHDKICPQLDFYIPTEQIDDVIIPSYSNDMPIVKFQYDGITNPFADFKQRVQETKNKLGIE